jgi:hypothetical protein
MLLSIQIAVGIWLGGLFLIGTIMAIVTAAEKIEKNRRYGYPWWYPWPRYT